MRSLSFAFLLVTTLTFAGSAQNLQQKRVACTDPQLGGMEAASTLIPADWQYSCRVQWNTLQGTAAIHAKFAGPDGMSAFEALPHQTYHWSTEPLFQQLKPMGSVYMGVPVYPPMNAQQYLQQFILPQMRGNLTDVKILSVTPDAESRQKILRDLAKQSQGVSARYDADVIEARLQYSENGRQKEEMIYLEIYVINAGGLITWGRGCRIVTAPAGQLQKVRKIAENIMHSNKVNPSWQQQVNQIRQRQHQSNMQSIRAAGQRSKIISDTSNQIADEQWQSYQKRQQAEDEMAKKRSQSIRGVESYTDPNDNTEVELPGGYDQGWSDGNGYLLSDDPNFDPNVEMEGEWTPLEKEE